MVSYINNENSLFSIIYDPINDIFYHTDKGIIYKKDNTTIKNPPEANVENLDDLPLPARDLFPMERYIPLPNQYRKLPLTNMVVIRGCPYFCTFCYF